MSKITLDTIGKFTFSFHHRFHIETENGNFEWSNPDYPDGDNTIQPCGDYNQWCKEIGIAFGRSKGTHSIRKYCGENVKFLNCE